MSQDNKLFSRNLDQNHIIDRSFGLNRPQWDENAYKDLNTYRSFNPIGLIVEPVIHGADENDEDFLPFGKKYGGAFEGRHSLFNAVNGVGNNLNYQVALNAPLLDTPEVREEIRRHSDCSVKALVDASARGEMGRALYRYSDFMFCKHLGRISNNYLITLRRFPFPCGDHINYTLADEANGHMPDIGRMVTWLGTPGNDMSAILKYDVNMPYKEMNAELQNGIDGDNSGGFLGGLMNIGSSTYQSAMLKGAAGVSGLKFIQKAAAPFGGNFTSNLSAPEDTSWAYHRDATKSYGPVDSIAKTHYRQPPEDGGGIKFEHNITLVFDYELRSFDGINTRAAFLDLLANILATTFTNAEYWGGAVRGTGAAQSNAFANLPIFHMNTSDMTFSGVVDKVFESFGKICEHFNNDKPINSAQDAINALGNLAKGVFTGITASALNALGRPQKAALNSLLNFAPTGLWHLTIGNPRHPIMSMGNMILDNCSIEHYGPLGLDDFPTGLKVTITLKHATPRDNLKIEQMYMNGDYRIYQPLGNRTYEAWETAEELNTPTSGDTENLAEAVDQAPTHPNDGTTSEQAAGKLNATQKRMIKYFGMYDNEAITSVGMEGYLGSQKRKKSTSNTGQQNNNSNNKK